MRKLNLNSFRTLIPFHNFRFGFAWRPFPRKNGNQTAFKITFNPQPRYERILSRIKRSATPEEWEVAHKLLGWMVCAKRPLKWHEMQAIISINPVDQDFDFDQRLGVHIRDLCGSLVRVLGDRIELVHSTARL
jgi:hypothetical protein